MAKACYSTVQSSHSFIYSVVRIFDLRTFQLVHLGEIPHLSEKVIKVYTFEFEFVVE
jgi:hypothetical protein